MSLKFRKKIRVFPGFTLNLSKSGMSATLGVRGCSVNIAKNGTYLNTGIPADSKNLGYTWKYCNKNGSPDRRYANNYQIPIQQYGEITISSSEGLNEEFMISNSDATDLFTTNLYNFIALLNKMNWNAQIIEDKA